MYDTLENVETVQENVQETVSSTRKIVCHSLHYNKKYGTYSWAVSIKPAIRPHEMKLDITLRGTDKTWRGVLPIDSLRLRYRSKFSTLYISAHENGEPKQWYNQGKGKGRNTRKPTRFGEFFQEVEFEPPEVANEKKVNFRIPVSKLNQIFQDCCPTCRDMMNKYKVKKLRLR